MAAPIYPIQDGVLRDRLYAVADEFLRALNRRDARELRADFGIGAELLREIDEELAWLSKDGKAPALQMPPRPLAYVWARGRWPFDASPMHQPGEPPCYAVHSQIWIDGQATEETLIVDIKPRPHPGRWEFRFRLIEVM
ncbi:MAG: hypothetical protein Q4G70_12690 [Pseudomonadota bacterium]|nr:hypothetical protein [Pseudomonadota bacterium]